MGPFLSGGGGGGVYKNNDSLLSSPPQLVGHIIFFRGLPPWLCCIRCSLHAMVIHSSTWLAGGLSKLSKVSLPVGHSVLTPQSGGATNPWRLTRVEEENKGEGRAVQAGRV